jgi:hypothetical protein
MDQKLGGLLRELRELDPLVRSSVLNFNARVEEASREMASPWGKLVARLSGYRKPAVCESSAIDLSTVRWAQAEAGAASLEPGMVPTMTPDPAFKSRQPAY